jgi:hypothetical protein
MNYLVWIAKHAHGPEHGGDGYGGYDYGGGYGGYGESYVDGDGRGMEVV